MLKESENGTKQVAYMLSTHEPVLIIFSKLYELNDVEPASKLFNSCFYNLDYTLRTRIEKSLEKKLDGLAHFGDISAIKLV